jgi:hypothetical protein
LDAYLLRRVTVFSLYFMGISGFTGAISEPVQVVPRDVVYECQPSEALLRHGVGQYR